MLTVDKKILRRAVVQALSAVYCAADDDDPPFPQSVIDTARTPRGSFLELGATVEPVDWARAVERVPAHRALVFAEPVHDAARVFGFERQRWWARHRGDYALPEASAQGAVTAGRRAMADFAQWAAPGADGDRWLELTRARRARHLAHERVHAQFRAEDEHLAADARALVDLPRRRRVARRLPARAARQAHIIASLLRMGDEVDLGAIMAAVGAARAAQAAPADGDGGDDTDGDSDGGGGNSDGGDDDDDGAPPKANGGPGSDSGSE